MGNLNKQDNFEACVCLKDHIKSIWKNTSLEEVLSQMTFNVQPISKEDKQSLPLFGFNKPLGKTLNEQLFPTHFVILELDTPAQWKNKILAGCSVTLQMAQNHFWFWYILFSRDPTLPYYWIYLTPSTCGLRFVLKTDLPVTCKEHYVQVVKQFLRILFLKTNGGVNPDFFDIHVNQAWFVPTFSEYFKAANRTFENALFDGSIKPVDRNQSTPIHRGNYPIAEIDAFDLALRFTKRHLSYIQGQRNKFIYAIACNCNRFGISESSAQHWMITNYDLGEYEITKTVASAYKSNGSQFGQFLINHESNLT